MTFPFVSLLIHGRPGNIEDLRARGLSKFWPSDRCEYLYRSDIRAETRGKWCRHIHERRPDLIYFLNTANPGALLGIWWARRYHIPYILDTGDMVYEMAKSSGVNARWKLPFLKIGERLAWLNAHTLVVRGTRHQEHLQHLGFKRVVRIRDGFAENQDVSPSSIAELKKLWRLEGRFVVGVMGSLIWSPTLNIVYGWDLIRALPLIQDSNVVALIIGDGDGQARLESLADSLGVRHRVVFAGRIPYGNVPAALRVMDIALSTQTNNLAGQVRTTGKLPEYLAAGSFILASRVGEAALVLPEPMLLDYHGTVDSGYPERLAQRILQIRSSPELRSLSRLLPDLARREFAYDVLAKQWNTTVQGVLDSELGRSSDPAQSSGKNI